MITECRWFRSLRRGSVSSLSVGSGRFGPWLSCSRWWIVTSHGRSRPIHRHLPNKRLKLAGGDRFKGNGVLSPSRATAFVPWPCVRRARGPQLKRDPLGSSRVHEPTLHALRSARRSSAQHGYRLYAWCVLRRLCCDSHKRPLRAGGRSTAPCRHHCRPPHQCMAAFCGGGGASGGGGQPR